MSPMMNRRDCVAALLAAGSGLGAHGARAEERGQIVPITPPDGPIPVAFLMDEAATMIDFAGPWEAFQDAMMAGVPGFYMYTVAPTMDPFETSGGHTAEGMKGMRILPDFTFADAPEPRVVVIPAQSRMRMPEKLEWVRKVAGKTDAVMSVCTGAFLLANTGLLDGLSATTHHDYFDHFARSFPKVRLERGPRFVDNGSIITSAGLTSGVDAALHVVARYYGIEAARTSARYMEYYGEGWLGS